MLIRLDVNCSNCDYSDRGKIVDAAVNPNEGNYPAATYIDQDNMVWQLYDYEFEKLSTYIGDPTSILE